MITRLHHLLIAVIAVIAVVVTLPAALAAPADLAPYQPSATVTGTIRIWGHGSYGAHTDFVEGLTRAWQDGFKARQPGVSFENRLHGTASAIGALYTGQGDLALMGREIWAPEVTAFNEVRGYAPTGIDVLTGSFDVRNKGYALVVFVHKDNPLAQLSLAQLDAAFGMERRRGHAAVKTWGDLGLRGEWEDKPVNLHGLAIARGFADFFEEKVFDGGHLWKPELHEFADDPGSKGGSTDGGQKLLDALAGDRYGLGYSGLLYGHPDVKAVALSVSDAGPFVAPTRASVENHSYALTRVITMFVDRKPGQPLDPKLAEFLRYILSREGQQAVVDHGHGYLTMPAAAVVDQLKKLQD